MHDAVKVALREAVERVLADLRHQDVTLASEPYLVWRRMPGGWDGAHEMRPTDTRAVDRAVNWEAQASSLDSVLLAHGCYAFRGLLTATTGYSHGSPSSLLRCFVCDVLRRSDSAAFNPAIVDQLIQDVSDFVDSTFIAIPFLVPLLNFTMDRIEPIAFNDDIVLRLLTDDEMTRMHGGILTGMRRLGEFPIHGFAFSGVVREEKEPGTTRSEGNPAVPEQLIAKLKRLVLGLRTFKAGPVGFDAIHFHSEGILSWLGGAPSLGFGDEYVPGGTYKILDAEVEPLRRHMQLVAADLHSSLEAACGRLAAAQVRIEPRDKVIDAVVGLEAILLHEAGDERGELRFRFAMNHALLHETPAERYKQFFVARDFYDLRSKLVHGVRVEEWKVGGQTLTLREAAEKACHMLLFVVTRFLPGGQRPEFLAEHYWLKRYFPS